MYNKMDFHTRTWYKIVAIIIARKQAVITTKLDQFGSGMS